jgi:hypothetical protein
MSRLLTHTVNMSQGELKAWLKNPRNLLASIETGHESLRRLSKGDHAHDPAFARKVDNFNTRHSLSTHLFGKEVGKSGWSKRAIALRNWGHDPSKASSPLFAEDKKWLREHDGAEGRRQGRVKNPVVIESITAPANMLGLLHQSAPFLSANTGGAKYYKMPGNMNLVNYIDEDLILGNTRTCIPIGDLEFTIGCLESYREPTLEARYKADAMALQIAEDLWGHMDDEDDKGACFYQLTPAISYGIYSKYPDVSRTPNPPLTKWILPVCQLLLSASSLVFSSLQVFEVFKSPSIKEKEALLEVAKGVQKSSDSGS